VKGSDSTHWRTGTWGDHAIDQLGGQLAHPAAPARGAEAPALAAERYDHLISAPLARDVHAAVLEPTTAQVGAELAGDEGGKSFAAPLLRGAGQQGLEMALQGAVEDRVLWAVALIARGELGQAISLGPGQGGDAAASARWSACDIKRLLQCELLLSEASVPTLLGAERRSMHARRPSPLR
jgi:hypothetical protein